MRYLWRQVRYMLAQVLLVLALGLIKSDLRLETARAFAALAREMENET